MNKIKSNNLAFTLAEVLITLGVIGVVAAITIPTLINNSQKSQYVSQLQKMTSVLNNGFKQIMADNNCSDIPCTGIMTTSADTTMNNIQAANVFKSIKTCYVSQLECHNKLGRTLHNQPWVYIGDYYSIMVLQDGSLFGIYTPSSDCSYLAGNNQYATVCAEQMILDINGVKEPNTLGRDIFKFYLSKYGVILPMGTINDTAQGYWDSAVAGNCRGNGTGDGNDCLGRIVEQGWQMNY